MTVETADMKTEPKTFGARTILLTSWASVATALFLMTLIGGAIYLTNLHERCDHDSSDTKDLHVRDGDDTEDIVLDNKQKTQLVVKKDKEGKIIVISTNDYNRKISATYLAEEDYCLLSRGDMDWYQTWNVTEVTEIDHEKEDETHYEQPDVKNRVTDLSLVPENMRPFCTGKQIYWTKRTAENDQDKNRFERAAVAAPSDAAAALYWCHYHGCGCWCCHRVIAIVLVA